MTVYYFCHVGPESIFHLFGTCEKLKELWTIASETVHFLTGRNFDFGYLRINLILDLVSVNLNGFNKFEKMLIYFNSIINHSIWKLRNQIKFEFAAFSIETVISKIIRTMKSRTNMESQIDESKRIPLIRDLCSSFMMFAKRFLPVDNG